jgi:hypothetical protein
MFLKTPTLNKMVMLFFILFELGLGLGFEKNYAVSMIGRLSSTESSFHVPAILTGSLKLLKKSKRQ